MRVKPSIFFELERRHVYRVAVAYVIAAWVLLQLASIVLPLFGAPNWVLKVFLGILVFGLPVAAILAWAYELMPDGIRRTEPIDSPDVRSAEDRHRVVRLLNRITLAVMSLVIIVLVLNTFIWHEGERSVAGDGNSAVPEESIAVLPLVNDSGDKDQQYFSDGLSENLITALSQIHGLKVIGRTSAFQFRDTKDDAKMIGAKLGVAHLLEGNVQRIGGEVRINADLINTADGSTLWSQRYDRPYTDLFALQDEITQQVAAALKAKLLPGQHSPAKTDRPPSGDLSAYNAYLRGNFYYARNTQVDLHKAISQFAQAVKIDSRYAQAWAWLSRCWAALAAQYLGGAVAHEAYEKARSSSETALSLAPAVPTAHIARGYMLLVGDLDWRGAEAEYKRAVELDPNNPAAKSMLGNLLATLGHPRQAITLTREALENDPLNAHAYDWLSLYLNGLGKVDAAERAVRKAIELQPAAAAYHEQLALVQIQRHDPEAALAAARAEPDLGWREDAVAMALQIGTDKAAAAAALKTIVDSQADIAPYQIAQTYALRGNADETFVWLEHAWKIHDPGINYLLYDPIIGRFRADPRFAAFCRKVGLPVPGAPAA